MEDTINIKGLKDLALTLEEFSPKLQRSYMRSAMRAGMNVVKPIARHNVHSVSGLLARGLKVSTSVSRNGVVTVKLKATGPHAFVARWVEYGTKSHIIQGVQAFGGGVKGLVHHPGARPHPFLRPALDGQARAAVEAMAAHLREKMFPPQSAFETDNGSGDDV